MELLHAGTDQNLAQQAALKANSLDVPTLQRVCGRTFDTMQQNATPRGATGFFWSCQLPASD